MQALLIHSLFGGNRALKAGYPFQVSESNEVSSRDELEQSIYNGYLDGLCEASATFCKRLEAQALEAEIEMRRAQKGRAHVSQSAWTGPLGRSNLPGITSWRLIHGDEWGHGREIVPSSHG